MEAMTPEELIAYHRARTSTVTRHLDGLDFRVEENVYIPGPEADETCRWLRGKIAGKTVYEYGCGSGTLATWSALQGANVIASDCLQHAIDNTERNAQLHGVSIDVRRGRGMQLRPGELVDVIIAHLPYDDGEFPLGVLERAFYDPGLAMRESLAKQAPEHLSADGSIIFSYSDRAHRTTPLERHFQDYQIREIGKDLLELTPRRG